MNSPRKTNKGGIGKEYIILIGNPGVGKSTILNGLIGNINFKSGVSYGEGMTKVLQLHEHKGIIYGDTPGLSDIKIRKQAAQEITQALRQNGKYRLFFVVTLESGRVKADDVTTMNLVLGAIEHKVYYGIIVNKASNRLIKDVTTNQKDGKANYEKIFAGLNTGMHKTDYIYFFKHNDDLHEEDNVLAVMPTDLIKFINDVPPTTIFKDKVKDVKETEFEEMKEKMQLEINEVRENAEKRIDAMSNTIADLERDRKEIKRQQEEQFKKFQQEQNKLKNEIEQERSQNKRILEEQKREFDKKINSASEENKKLLIEQKEQYEADMKRRDEENKNKQAELEKEIEAVRVQEAETRQQQDEAARYRQECNQKQQQQPQYLIIECYPYGHLIYQI